MTTKCGWWNTVLKYQNKEIHARNKTNIWSSGKQKNMNCDIKVNSKWIWVCWIIFLVKSLLEELNHTFAFQTLIQRQMNWSVNLKRLEYQNNRNLASNKRIDEQSWNPAKAREGKKLKETLCLLSMALKYIIVASCKRNAMIRFILTIRFQDVWDSMNIDAQIRNTNKIELLEQKKPNPRVKQL